MRMSTDERLMNLVRYLDDQKVEYRVRRHVPAYKAHDVAAATHAPDSEMAKTLIVQAGQQKWMVILRADYRIDQRLLRDALEQHSIHMVPEEELETLFPNCEVGAMPPFGNLYGIPVIVNKQIAEEEEIVFNACTHSDSIRMKYRDFARLANPMVATVAVPEHAEESKAMSN
jgi:Ala-tRNA(Pro) deacylase